jgi:P27 family predicted phage terminase small subunit
MRGPPPQPLHLRVLRGNPGKRALRREVEPPREPECPEPPPFLAAYACDEWWRTAPSLHRLGLLTVADVNPLAAYCQAYARWREAEEVLAEMKARDPLTKGLLVKTVAGDARRNPLVKIAADAAGDMVTYAGHFGLSPVARSRLAAGINGQPAPGKFDGLFGGQES